MAEEDAEQAFFRAQAMSAEYDPAAVVHGAELSGSEDYDPSNTVHEEYSATIAEDNQNGHSEENPTTSAPQSDGDGNTQDQNAASQPPSRTESRASVSAPDQPKTKTIGGFVIDDDEEEEEEEEEQEEEDKDEAEYEPPGVLGAFDEVGSGSASMSERPFSENANETVFTSGVSIQPPAPPMGSSKDVSNNAVSSSSHSASVSLSTGQIPYTENTYSNAPTPVPLASNPALAASRGRLPHDRVGLLEDRIKEDPRGDIAAWLELIGEHRSRNRLDNARDVYERFFQVFPSAVWRPFSQFCE
jgi:cleavage stimulation factor subunit 3